MKRVIFLFATGLLSMLSLFSSCDSEELLEQQPVSSEETLTENKPSGEYVVDFVNPDGTPFIDFDSTKVVWGGSRTSYPYKTYVETTWSTFCSSTGDYVKLSGGQGGSQTLTSGSYAITPASGITKDYTISVQKGYTITGNTTTGGTISPNGPTKVDAGSSLTLRATPSSGYEFSKFITSTGWEITTNNKVVTPSASYTVTAYFKQKVTTPDYYTLTITVRATGIEYGKSEKLVFTATNVYSGSSVRNVTVSKTGSQTVSYQIKAGQTTSVSVSSPTNYYGRYFSDGVGESVSIKMDSDKSTICYVNY